MTHIAGLAQNTSSFDMSVFPQAEKGWAQHIINLPLVEQGADQNYKVEMYVGKYAEVDMCNSFGLLGELEEKELTGYGYNYYSFNTSGDIMGTMMGCSDRSKQTKFVISRSLTMRYNPNMPIVIYTPQGYEVRYKIFKALDMEYKAYTK